VIQLVPRGDGDAPEAMIGGAGGRDPAATEARMRALRGVERQSPA